jgi:3-hydroxyacyl-CoA dehydrogenase
MASTERNVAIVGAGLIGRAWAVISRAPAGMCD